ncbi:MRPL35 [Mytilus edulis]|uniref:Large ribosomal subunit protein bL35m n=1 Tax=Mytilus edulis TaxID=6550 RepID=A0A8S3TU58_MYTED|nr:MRPL35 [Mytilus edulis]
MAAPMKKFTGLLPPLCKAFSACCHVKPALTISNRLYTPIQSARTYSILPNGSFPLRRSILQNYTPLVQTSVRTRMDWAEPTIVCDKKEGKPQSNKNVLKRFKRLNCGLWIRTRAGRSKKLWRMGQQKKWRHRLHVVCNASQSTLLDKMVTKYWKKKTYFVDDPYEPYQKRTKMEKFGVDIQKPKFVP